MACLNGYLNAANNEWGNRPKTYGFFRHLICYLEQFPAGTGARCFSGQLGATQGAYGKMAMYLFLNHLVCELPNSSPTPGDKSCLHGMLSAALTEWGNETAMHGFLRSLVCSLP